MKPLDEMNEQEIRLEIAERNGWAIEETEVTPGEIMYCIFCGDAQVSDQYYDENNAWYEIICNNTLPDWPASIAAAWELVDDMDNNGKWVQMRTPFIDDGYWCGCTPKGITGWNGTPDLWMNAPTAPLAICKAWLAWKRSEEK
jgi:hypothetical protein